MKNNVLVSFEEPIIGCSAKAIQSFINVILKKRNHSSWEVSILLCSDANMQKCNKTYRGIDSPTDVLSFETGDFYIDEKGKKWYLAGDIAISPESMVRNCKEFDVSVNEELKRLLIHGILHLEGMEHANAHVSADACIAEDTNGSKTDDNMLTTQELLLKKMADYILIKEKE
ncbi:MAG TPA: rRNA maturation RNase YbeY [Treponemataceae bacterium]|nr:rRNA maturation RNase YbeY [Treponemataceae bacterium]